ncbi:hypothetical protein HMPREF1868_00717 [Olsenella sp. DNF00959]|nr:hypothetical protein HMPREF1868_00717 [Olsenella sp. DNF00959]
MVRRPWFLAGAGGNRTHPSSFLPELVLKTRGRTSRPSAPLWPEMGRVGGTAGERGSRRSGRPPPEP